MKLLVVGAGEIGRWVADTLADASALDEIAFADRDAAVARDAAASRDAASHDATASHGATTSRDATDREAAVARDAGTAVDAPIARAVPTDTDETFDAVCLAVPMSAVADAVSEYADNADRAMFDVSGAMATPIEAMREHVDGERASYHPLFAPPRVPGNVAAVVDEGGPITDAVHEAIEAGGNDVFETTAVEHDEAMKTVQSGAHAAILAWALAADDVREEFHTPVSAGLQELVETVTEGAPGVYGEIQDAFDGADAVADAAREIADADRETFEHLYEVAGEDTPGRDRHE